MVRSDCLRQDVIEKICDLFFPVSFPDSLANTEAEKPMKSFTSNSVEPVGVGNSGCLSDYSGCLIVSLNLTDGLVRMRLVIAGAT